MLLIILIVLLILELGGGGWGYSRYGWGGLSSVWPAAHHLHHPAGHRRAQRLVKPLGPRLPRGVRGALPASRYRDWADLIWGLDKQAVFGF